VLLLLILLLAPGTASACGLVCLVLLELVVVLLVGLKSQVSLEISRHPPIDEIVKL
jgi:hypothetical protein